MLHMKKAFVRMEEGLAIFSRFPILTSDYILLYRYMYNIVYAGSFIVCIWHAVYWLYCSFYASCTRMAAGSLGPWRRKCMTEQTSSSLYYSSLCSLFLFGEPVVTAVDLPCWGLADKILPQQHFVKKCHHYLSSLGQAMILFLMILAPLLKRVTVIVVLHIYHDIPI